MRHFGTEIRTWLPKPQAATFIVAASDSLHKERADFKCNGTDDQVDIQAAIDALPASGGKVILLDGTFIVTEHTTDYGGAIIVRDNVTIQGMGFSTIIKLKDNSYPSVHSRGIPLIGRERAAPWATVSNVVIKDLQLDGNKANNMPVAVDEKNYSIGISVDVMSDVVIENVLIHDCPSGGIYIETAAVTPSRIQVKNAIIHDCGLAAVVTRSGLHLDNVYGVVLDNIISYNNVECGFFFNTAYDIIGTNLFAHDNSSNGIKISAGCERCKIDIETKNNTGSGANISASYVSLSITTSNEGANYVTIGGSYNTIHVNAKGNDNLYGIYLYGDNNDIHYNGTNFQNGIYLTSAVGNNISGVASINQNSGIRLNNGSNRNLISMSFDGNSQALADSYSDIYIHDSFYNVVHGCVFQSTLATKTRSNVRDAGTSDYTLVINNQMIKNYTRYAELNTHSKAYEQHADLFMDVLAVSATHVRSNEALNAAIPITFTITAQPDIPRTLSGHFDSHAQITEYDIEIIGVDAKGNTVTETKDETDGWDWETNNAFATITSIKMTSRTGTGAGDTMDIGITDVLGLSNIIYATSDVFKIKKNNANAVVAVAQVNTTYDTYDMAVIGLAVGDDFTIWFKSNLNIIS